VLVFALHALDVPVVGLFHWVVGVQNVGDAESPVPDAHILYLGDCILGAL
jgi:hypothetical protein